MGSLQTKNCTNIFGINIILLRVKSLFKNYHGEIFGEAMPTIILINYGQTVEEDELKKFCREHLAGFKMPKTFVFQVLPKTSTGKIQKYELRETVKNL